MGTYIDKDDVKNEIGASNLAIWSNLNRDDAEEDATRITWAIAWAERTIEAQFRGSQYLIPLSATSGTLGVIKSIVAKLAAWKLYSSRGMMDDNDEVGGSVQSLKDDAETEMSRIISGELELAAVLSEPNMPSAPIVII